MRTEDASANYISEPTFNLVNVDRKWFSNLQSVFLSAL